MTSFRNFRPIGICMPPQFQKTLEFDASFLRPGFALESLGQVKMRQRDGGKRRKPR